MNLLTFYFFITIYFLLWFCHDVGYFVVLIYEYAAIGREKSEQTAATRLLNICFQLAAFTAVLMSVTVTSLGWLDHVIPTVDDIYYDDQYVQPAVVNPT